MHTEPSRPVFLHLTNHTQLRRGKRRVDDRDLHTTRLIGAGWTWDCDCGEKGGWHSTRAFADESRRIHLLYAHNQK